jgi:DNA (cytosine-5)-methyltransferase 1
MGQKKSAKILSQQLCEPIAKYCADVAQDKLLDDVAKTKSGDIRVIELFAGVGGFRIGLERASCRYKTVWNSQWEPSTKTQDASIVYRARFGDEGHSNVDIATVSVDEIKQGNLLVGGFPCQDYSVASTLKRSGGIEGKKGVLWWQIHRILRDSKNPPKYLFLENVDRLLKSPVKQRGRDFAIILASLSDLGYSVEWRVVNAADYGMPQRRRRTYIVAYKDGTKLAKACSKAVADEWILNDGILAQALKCKLSEKTKKNEFEIKGDLVKVTEEFNKGQKNSPFFTAGFMSKRKVCTFDVVADYSGKKLTLGELLVDEKDVPEEFFIDEKELTKWEYLKGGKSEKRKTAEGFEYNYSEGPMAFPDFLDKPSRTIITGEGGKGPSRFKHVIKTKSGRYRRLVPIELERLNMFPDNHTEGASNLRRAFLMGNALVTGIVENVGRVLEKWI